MPHFLRSRGFTLIELITVLVLTGILGAYASSRYAGGSNFDATIYVDQLQSMLRHAQKLAIAQQLDVYVDINGGRAALCYDVNCTPTSTNHVPAPAGQSNNQLCGADKSWFCLAAPRGVTMTNGAFFFNAGGKVSLTSRLVIVIGSPDGVARSIVIENETGYVH